MNINLKILISVSIIILFSLKLSAQNWPKIFSYNEITQTRDLLSDYDGGVIFCGDVSEDGSYAGLGFLNKTDVNGETLWIKFFGNEEYNVGLNDIKKTSDNGYLLSGWTDKRLADDWDPLFLKLNTCGEIEWCTILNSELGEGSDYAVDAVELADGSIIGQLKYYGNQIQTIRISLIKMDNYGNPLWIQHLAQNDSTIFNEAGYELLLTADSSLLITGDLPADPYFIKTDLLANELWSLKWETEGGSNGVVQYSQENLNGNYFTTVGLFATSEHPRAAPAIIKTDKYGFPIMHKHILGDSITHGGAGPFQIYNDTLLVMGVGWTTEQNPLDDGNFSVIITDTIGNFLNITNLYNYYQCPDELIITQEGKIVVIGNLYTGGKVKTYLWKLNIQLEDDSINNNTIVYDSLCNQSIQTDTLDISCDVFVNVGELPTQQEYLNPVKVWPNPANEKISIKIENNKKGLLKIYSNLGQEKFKKNITDTSNVDINISHWNKGIYIVCFMDNSKYLYTKKIIVN